jgi:hypothetical protein
MTGKIETGEKKSPQEFEASLNPQKLPVDLSAGSRRTTTDIGTIVLLGKSTPAQCAQRRNFRDSGFPWRC